MRREKGSYHQENGSEKAIYQLTGGCQGQCATVPSEVCAAADEASGSSDGRKHLKEG